MTPATKVIVALLGVIAAALASLPIATYSRVRDARKFVSAAPDIGTVTERFGPFSHRIDDPEKLAGWRVRFPIDIAPGDTLFVKSQEGFPYWVILLVSPDSSSIRSRHVGYYPL